MQTLETLKLVQSQYGTGRRWFDPREQENTARDLAGSCLSATPLDLDEIRRAQQQKRIIATVLAALVIPVFFIVMIVILSLGQGAPKVNPVAKYTRITLFCLGLTSGVAGVTWVCTGSTYREREKRAVSLAQLLQGKPNLKFLGRAELPKRLAGTLPWFESEEDEVHGLVGLAAGSLEDLQVCLVEGYQSLDPIMAMTDSHLLKAATYLVRKRQQALYRNELEALVLLEQLKHVPDLLVIRKKDPNRGYYVRALGDQLEYVADQYLPAGLRGNYRVASSDTGKAVRFLTPELERLVKALPTGIVQVVGGYCSVVTAQWHGSRPGEAPRDPATLEQNWKVAAAICRALRDARGEGQSASAVSSGQRPAECANLLPAAAPQGGSRRHSLGMLVLLFGLGIPMILLAGLLGFAAVYEPASAAQVSRWPTVQGVVTRSELKTLGSGDVRFYQPIIEYTYTVDQREHTGDRLRFGIESLEEDREQVEATLADYPLGAGVLVHYRPSNPGCAALKAGLDGKETLDTLRNVSIFLGLIGLVLCVYGVMGKKVD